MSLGLLGKKLGMSQIFDENGTLVPVTLIEAGPCPILQKKEKDKDGYNALQIGFDPKPKRRVSKPEMGRFNKSNVSPVRFIREIHIQDASKYEVGQVLDVEVFKKGEKVDVTGLSKGRGFAGTVKRHHSKRGPESHGSMYHRRPGSMGGSSDPSRVFKGKALPGHMGNARCTILNLKVVRTDKDKNLLVLRGSVPGHMNSYLIIRKSVKGQREKRKAE
jgi:large subunit ribosomal protein L3